MMDYLKRQKNLLKVLSEKSVDGFITRKKQNIAYLTGVRGEDAALFISTTKKIIITDYRYSEEYAKSVQHCSVKISKARNIYESIAEISSHLACRRIGFESNNLSYREYLYLKTGLSRKRLVPLNNAIEHLRMVKDKDEIALIKTACKKGSMVMEYGLGKIRVGLSEKSVKNMIEQYVVKKGLAFADFDIIVAAGKNASMPHATSSARIIRKNDMVIVDLGIMHNGYNSDLTRTIFLGKINQKYAYIYHSVMDAQKKAISRARPGIEAKQLDNISRQYIRQKGLGRYFIHSLGHGIGRQTHEEPAISSNNSTVLEENMVITIEPGVYIPGWGGIRIEDVVLVTKNGCEVLTDVKK